MGLDLSINFATIGIYTTVSFGFYLLATYITTWLESSPAKPDTGREPPMAPYYLPYIGHMLEFLSNPGKTVQKYRLVTLAEFRMFHFVTSDLSVMINETVNSPTITVNITQTYLSLFFSQEPNFM